MDDTKSNRPDSDSLVNEPIDNEASESKEEKQLSHVTSSEKEVIETDEHGQLLRRVAEPEALESVQKYAKRIKSFLGWEPFLEELGKDRTESTDDSCGIGDPDCSRSGIKDSRADERDILSKVTGVLENERDAINPSDVINESPENESRSIEPNNILQTGDISDPDDRTEVDASLEIQKNTGDITIKSPKNENENIISETEDKFVQDDRTESDASLENPSNTNDLIHTSGLINEFHENINEIEIDEHNPKTEETDASLENHRNMSDLINNNLECDKNLIGSDKGILGIENLNNNEIDNHQTAEDNIEIGSVNESDHDMDEKTGGDIKSDNKNRDCFNNNSEFRRDLTKYNEELSNGAKPTQGMISECSIPNNELKIYSVDIDSAEDQCLNDNPKNDIFVNTSDEEKALALKNSVPLECESKKGVESEISDKDDMRRDENNDGNFDSDTTDFRNASEATACNAADFYENNVEFEDITCSANNEKQTANHSKEDESFEDNQEDLESKDSMYLDESIALKRDTDKPILNEIRRLSMGIVKDVLESARSSVYEIVTNKSEETKDRSTSELSENITNNETDRNREPHHVNGNKSLEETFSQTPKNVEKILENTSKGDNDPSEIKNIEIQTELVDDKDNMIDEDVVCGFGCFKPRWIQQYSRPKVFLTLFSIMGVIHGCYYPYFVSLMSTLEKRYAFQTKVSGVLLLADEITPLFLGVIMGYIGGRTHRPRMVSIGMFMSVACCFISGLPYLIYGPAKHLAFINYTNKTGPEVCDAERNFECNADDAPPTMTVVGIFLVASFLKGFATISYYVIGIPYMDDNIKKKNSPLYLAIALAMRLLGPLVGFLMSSAFLKLYENPADDPGYGPDDPRWVGAWWIGFFLQGILLIIFTIPIALFPRRLPGQRRMEKNTAPAEEDGFKQIYLGLCSALKRLLTNPVFVLFTINTNMKIFGHYGHSIMLPKYMENQFRLSASEASLYSGAISIFCVMISTMVGGYLIWKYRPTIKKLLAGMITSEAMLCVGFLILIIPRCQTIEMMNFGSTDEGLILSSTCNQMCDCSTTSYTPFCGPEGTTYFSPCYAGCTEEITQATSSKMRKEFRNCSCVASLVDQHLNVTIYEGYCPDDKCWSQALTYLIIYFILLSISNAFTVAHSMILLRSVHPNDKSIALGTFETFICLFGFIPFPVTFGALVDSACLVWEKTCGETGNCWFYDMSRYAWLVHGFGALFCSFSTMCLIGLYFLSPRVRDLYADDEEEKEDVVNIKLDTVSGSVTKL